MQRAVKTRSLWLRLGCALFALFVIASGTRATYYFCGPLQQAHSTPCCKSAEKTDARGGPAVAPVCCEERSIGSLEEGTPPGAAAVVALAAQVVTELLPSPWQEPQSSALRAGRWPIRAGPTYASRVVVELRVILS